MKKKKKNHASLARFFADSLEPFPARNSPTRRLRAAARAKMAKALEAAGVAETWEELQEGKWQPLIDSLSEGLEVTEHSCAGPDGNTVPLCMIRPEGATGSIPCAYYIHAAA